MNKKGLLVLTVHLLISGFLLAQPRPGYTSADALEKTLDYRPERVRPLLLAHRGGPQLSETENSLETFQHTYQQVPDAILEMDVRMTADSVLVLLHDDAVERTTTGTGSLAGMTWASIQQFFLRDLQGKPTQQRVTRFDAVLRWGAGRVLMAIDAKPGVDLRRVMTTIAKANALHSIFIICYSTNDALWIRSQYPDCWIALGFTEPGRIDALRQAGLSVRHLIALASRQTPDFYRTLHAAGIPCTVGTYGDTNLDAQPITQVADEYRRLIKIGADIITTDRPVDVATLFD